MVKLQFMQIKNCLMLHLSILCRRPRIRLRCSDDIHHVLQHLKIQSISAPSSLPIHTCPPRRDHTHAKIGCRLEESAHQSSRLLPNEQNGNMLVCCDVQKKTTESYGIEIMHKTRSPPIPIEDEEQSARCPAKFRETPGSIMYLRQSGSSQQLQRTKTSMLPCSGRRYPSRLGCDIEDYTQMQDSASHGVDAAYFCSRSSRQ